MSCGGRRQRVSTERLMGDERGEERERYSEIQRLDVTTAPVTARAQFEGAHAHTLFN